MLPNYDAEAIADVLGLAFVRGAEGGSAPAETLLSDKRQSAEVQRDSAEAAVITVHREALFVVESEPAAFGAPPVTRTAESSPGIERGMAPASSVAIEKAVENGLPRASLRHVAVRLAGGDSTKVPALEWRVVPKTTLERRDVKLSIHESERTERIARLLVHARRALGTEAEAREFMMTPHPELDGCSPFDAARTDLGTRRAEQLLTALEYGLAL